MATSDSIVTSKDGLTWTRAEAPRPPLYTRARYGEGRLFVVGSDGTLMSSKDGTTWVAEVSNTTKPLSDVAAGNGVVVAVGGEGTIVTRRL